MIEKQSEGASKLGRLGVWATVIYIVSVAIFIAAGWKFGFVDLKPLSLNELGDFLAGAFGPLAIFWLVLGFFQQGRELRLQVRELALSVEQQKELVGVTRETLDHERNLQTKQEIERKAGIQPKFIVEAAGGSHSGGKVKNSISITNVGASVSEVTLNFEKPTFTNFFRKFDIWNHSQSEVFRIQFNEKGSPSPNTLNIRFKDADSVEATYFYELTPIPERLTAMSVKQINRAPMDD